MKTFDKKSFGQSKAAITRSSSVIKQHVQALIEMGLSHYQATGDTAYLTDAMVACEGQRSLPNKSINGYIQAHANVRWVRSKNKQGEVVVRYKKVGEDIQVIEPEQQWFEHETNSANTAKPMDVMQTIDNALKRIQRAIDKGTVNDPELAKKAVALMAQFETENAQ